MDQFMRDSLKMVKNKVKDYISGVKDVFMRESGARIWYMVKEDMNGQMVG